jgi:hypothetical protein
MNLAELKTVWTMYDRKIQTTHTLSDSIISSMIRARSVSRVSWIEKVYAISFGCNFLWVILSAAVIVKNPLGFVEFWQYIPILILNLSLVVLLLISIKNYSTMKAIDISQSNLDSSLRQVILAFEKPWKYLKWNINFILLSAFLSPVSFLPITMEALGLWPALSIMVASMFAVALIYLISAKFGVFKERYGAQFKEDLNELTALKSIAVELSEGA